MSQGVDVRVWCLFFIVLCSCSLNAKEPVPLASCVSYEMNRIDIETGEFVLKNVFAEQLFDNLGATFSEHQIDWTAWTTSVDEYKGGDGKEKTKLKGCFNITDIYDNEELISSIMRISMTRFQAAMKFYSKPNSEFVPKGKVDSMHDEYERLLREPKIKEKIEEVVGDGT